MTGQPQRDAEAAEMNEREATPDEAFELGKVAGYDEGWDEASRAIVKWLRDHDKAAPMWEWSSVYADYIKIFFADAPKYGEVERP